MGAGKGPVRQLDVVSEVDCDTNFLISRTSTMIKYKQHLILLPNDAM